MAQQIINVGTVANDGTGDTVRDAFIKAKSNDAELYAAIATYGTAATKNVGTSAGQVPLLDAGGLLETSVLPPLAITKVNVVASQSAMLALTAQEGDVAVRSDLNKSYILSTNSPSTLADWKELLTPTDAVLSVAGQTGTISKASLLSALNVADGADVTSATNVGTSIHGATGKTTPVDADELALIDSAASNVLKKLTWANLKAAIAAYIIPSVATTNPVPTSGGGAITNASSIMNTFKFGPEVQMSGQILLAAGLSGGSGELKIPLPYTPISYGGVTMTNVSTGALDLFAYVSAGDAFIHIWKTGFTSPLIASSEYRFNGVYFV